MNKGIWFTNLSGLRFVAFLSIFFSHSLYTSNPDIHPIALFCVNNLFLFLRVADTLTSLLIQGALDLALSMAATWLSYRYFEQYFLRWKKRFSPTIPT